MRGETGGTVIVGGGQAAAVAAKTLRACGYALPITIIGAEAHPPYERPPLSKKLLLEPDAPSPVLLTPEYCSENGIRTILGKAVVSIDREARAVTVEGGEIERYDKLILATGSRVRLLDIPGVPADRILYLRTIDDSRALRARLVPGTAAIVVGGGFIGLEAAASAVALGCDVTVIEAADRLLPRLGCAEASDEVLAHHRAIGIDVRLGATVSRGEGGGLILGDGSLVKADVIIAGVGVAPDATLAAAAGLEVDDGVIVDANGATSDPDIYAAGDVTRGFNRGLGRRVRLESWHNANLQADAVGRAIAGAAAPDGEAPWVWSDQGELNLQIAGAPARVTRTVRRGLDRSDGGLAYFQYDGEQLVGAVTINRGREMPLIRRLLNNPHSLPPADALADDTVPLRRLLSARESV